MPESDLRSYYDEKFQQLNELMTRAKWDEVGKILVEACSDENLTTSHPIGLIRFCSTARTHIGVWNDCLDVLEERVKNQSHDQNLHPLRGLKRNSD